MPVPTWVDFEFAERSAATMARGLSGSSSKWEMLLANAQGILSSRMDMRSSDSSDSYDFDDWQDLVAAARILDLAATENGFDDAEDRKTAALLAACAFGMSGAAVSSGAVIRSHDLLSLDLSPGELTALAISCPAMTREIIPKLPVGSSYRNCAELITSFLASGEERLIGEAARELGEAMRQEGGSWEIYLLQNCRLSLFHIARLSVAKVLARERSRFPDGYLERLVDDSPMLLPSQYEAITGQGILSSDRNLLITLPTGTGKTLLGELALMSATRGEAGLVCYVAPYIALGRQVSDKINRHTPPDIRVHRLFGGYQAPDQLDPHNRLEVVVATPERFDAMLRIRPEYLRTIRCVVFDEAHMVGGAERGIRLEGLLTRLRLAEARGEQVPRFVLLSAVLSNSDALARWLGITPDDVIVGTWHPSAKRLLLWTEDGMLRMHAGDDPLRDSPTDVLGETRLPWPNVDFYSTSHYGANRKQEPRALENVAYLADFSYRQYEQPVLCVCSTRPKTRNLASQLAQRFEPIEPLPRAISSITNLIEQRHPYLRPLKEALQCGVAYHNSSLPHDIREGIERAVENRALKVVAATTTLAEGVDLPFRVTILADWLMFDGQSPRPMENLLFKNIAGRCGRAGQFTEGDTIVFDNPIGEARLTSPARRRVIQHPIFFSGTQPVLESAIARVNQDISSSMVGSQLLAAIPENPDVDDLLSEFHRYSFAYQTDGAVIARERMAVAFNDILDDTQGEPLAIASSPAQLTDFGKAASVSGLSPSTARRLRTVLEGFPMQVLERNQLVAISVELLVSLGSVPEQTNPELRKAVGKPNSYPVVRLGELELVMDRWLVGDSLEDIFAALPANLRSKRRPPLRTWLLGVRENSTWTDQFAKFYDFIRNCVQFFLPWIMRAAGNIAESTAESELPWDKWADFVEHGVDTTWGVLLIEEEIITERTTARRIGLLFENLAQQSVVITEQIRQELLEILDNGPSHCRTGA